MIIRKYINQLTKMTTKKKKIVSLLVISAMIVGTCGCSNTVKEETQVDEAEVETRLANNTEQEEVKLDNPNAADYVYQNGLVYTEDSEKLWASAFAIKDNKFIYVGDDNTEELKNLIGETTIVTDLQGKMVTPNLIDAHTHPGTVAMTKWCTSIDGQDKETLLAQIAEGCEENKDPYIFFKCYPSDLFGEAGPRKEWLDEIEPDRPIAISDFNDHSLWVNSKWYEVYGANDPDVIPKKIEGFRKDANGYTGLIEELGWMDYMDEFYETLGWRPPIDASEEVMSWVPDDLKLWGVTGVFDGYIESDDQAESIYNLDQAGKLNMYYDMSVKMSDYADLEDTIARIKSLNTQYKTDHVKIDTIKIFYDGTNELGTSALVDGTIPDPNNHGYLFMDKEQTKETIRRANEEGIDVHFHMVGDLAFRQVCDAVEELQNEIGQLSSQVEFCHCEYINPADRERPAKLGIIVNWTPHWTGGYFGEAALTYLGEERYNDMYYFNPLIESGAIVTFGSDIYSWDEEYRANPYFGMQIAMTRIDIDYPLEDEDGNIKARESDYAKFSLEDLLKGYTINAAIALRIDDITGSIEVGKYANFNIYSQNLFDVEVEEFKDVLPETVIFEGKELNK